MEMATKSVQATTQQLITDGRTRHEFDLPAVVAAVWHEVRSYRVAIHRSHPTARCDVRVSTSQPTPGNARAIRFDGDCACRDFLVDMIVECHRLLAGRSGDLRNPVGAARVHVRLRAAPDWNRERRIAMGAQARSDRVRTCSRARALPDEFHRALLEYLVDEAGSMAPLEDQHELLHRLAFRCAREFGGTPERYLDRVVDGVAVVERKVRSGPRVNAGTKEHPEYVTWWERFVERPLGRRPRRTTKPISTLPDADADLSHGYAVDPVDTDPAEVDERVVAILVDAVRIRPDTLGEALRTGIARLVDHGLLTERSAAVLLADRSRLASAARELSAMV